MILTMTAQEKTNLRCSSARESRMRSITSARTSKVQHNMLNLSLVHTYRHRNLALKFGPLKFNMVLVETDALMCRMGLSKCPSSLVHHVKSLTGRISDQFSVSARVNKVLHGLKPSWLSQPVKNRGFSL